MRIDLGLMFFNSCNANHQKKCLNIKEIDLPIPELDANGLLPVGIHDCTEDEVYQRFGRFSSSDRRFVQFGKLQEYLRDAKTAGLFSAVIVNGSFTTSKPEPGDIDLIAVLTSDLDLTIMLRPFH